MRIARLNMRLAPLLTGCLLAGCVRSRVDEPAAATDAAVVIEAPGGSVTESIDGGWFEVKVPPRWQSLPLTTDKRRAMFAKQLNTPRDQPDVLVLIARPRPFELALAVADGGTSNTTARLARTLNLSQGQPADAATETGTLAGAPAIVVAATGTKPGGQPISMKTWGAIKDGHLLMLTCGGTGPGLALAARLCPDIVASFKLPAPLPAPPPVVAPALTTLAARTVGDVTVAVPAAWETTGPDWFPAPAVFGVRSPSPATGPFEVATLHVSRFPGAPSVEALAEPLGNMPTMTRLRRVTTSLPAGAAIESELSDGLGSRSLLFDLVKGGVGYELTCEGPERGFEAYRPLCLAAAKSLVIGAAPKKN